MNIDKYFSKVYDPDVYNCAHFVSELWEDYTGENIRSKLLPLLQPVEKRSAPFNLRKNFTKLPKPVEPCIVLMHRRRCGAHVGFYISNKVLHITDVRVELVHLHVAAIGFDSVGFYK